MRLHVCDLCMTNCLCVLLNIRVLDVMSSRVVVVCVCSIVSNTNTSVPCIVRISLYWIKTMMLRKWSLDSMISMWIRVSHATSTYGTHQSCDTADIRCMHMDVCVLPDPYRCVCSHRMAQKDSCRSHQGSIVQRTSTFGDNMAHVHEAMTCRCSCHRL